MQSGVQWMILIAWRRGMCLCPSGQGSAGGQTGGGWLVGEAGLHADRGAEGKKEGAGG